MWIFLKGTKKNPTPRSSIELTVHHAVAKEGSHGDHCQHKHRCQGDNYRLFVAQRAGVCKERRKKKSQIIKQQLLTRVELTG